MHLTILQAKLKALGFYTGITDGKDGPKTQAAIDAYLKAGAVNVSKFAKDRVRLQIAAEQLAYKDAGLVVGEIDGLVGPQTTLARGQFTELVTTGKITYWRDAIEATPPKSALGTATPAKPAIIQARNAFPLQKDCEKFYGKPGTGHASIELPYTQKIAWDLKSTVNKITVHEKIADPVVLAYTKIKSAFSAEDIIKHGFDLFGGCFNIRPMRGGTTLSMHAYACAIDTDPERNQLKWNHTKAYFGKTAAVKEWFDIWESVGAISLGRERDFDWMHVQFARLA